jgi:hypothetical protein
MRDLSTWRPRQDSNLRSRLRRAVLYPLSYGGRNYVRVAAVRFGRRPTAKPGTGV